MKTQALCLAVFYLMCGIICALPTSDLNTKDAPTPKVKRAEESKPSGSFQPNLSLDPALNALYVSPPQKRGGGVSHRLPLSQDDQDVLAPWDQDSISSAFSERDPLEDEKTLAEYEKGYRYNTNRAKLAESLENAVLKSELYGEPPAVNQYRYYGMGGERRKRGGGTSPPAPVDSWTGQEIPTAQKQQPKKVNEFRQKRELDLNADEVLALFSLWEAQRDHSKPNYPMYPSPSNYHYNHYPSPANYPSFQQDDSSDEDSEDNWYDGPVVPSSNQPTHFPHELGNQYAHLSQYPTKYDFYKYNSQFPVKRQWAGFGSAVPHKRFMVAKKRGEPDYRYFERYPISPASLANSYSDDDVYTLAELINSAPRNPSNLPVVRRPVL